MALLLSFTMLHPCLCREKSSMAGVNLASLIRGTAEVEFCYGFSKNFSIKGEAALTYKKIIRGESQLEAEHNTGFGTTEDSQTDIPADTDLHNIGVLLCYWPRESFSGAHLGLGLQSGSSTDIILEAGYTIPLWKGIGLSLGIQIPLIRSLTEEHLNARYLNACINYRF